MNADHWPELLELAQSKQEDLLRARIEALAGELVRRSPAPAAEEPYGRTILHHTALGEVMLAGWGRAARSAPHDHGRAHGFVVVLAGTFAETSYGFDGCELRPLGTRALGLGDVLRASPGQIHDMRAGHDGATLHFYWPAVHAMRVYDCRARTTLRVSDACGAWLPREPALVLERTLWAVATASDALPDPRRVASHE